MAKVEIYTTKICPFCHSAKRLLKNKGVKFDEIDVTFDFKTRRAMTKRAGGSHTVPQIFIDGVHVGGCDDLMELDMDGKLEPMLGQRGA